MTKRREQVSDEAWRKGIDDLEAVFLRLLWLCNGDPYEIEDAVKRCPSCDRVLPAEDFKVNRANKDGRQTYCRKCQQKWAADHRRSENERKRRWEAENSYPCEGCGQPLTPRRGRGPLCVACRRHQEWAKARERTEQLLRMRRSGMTNGEIGAAVERSAHWVADHLRRANVAHYDLEWLPAPRASSAVADVPGNPHDEI